MLAHGLLRRLVDGQQGLAGAPVHLADELTTEGVDDTGNRRGLALADEVEIQHALDGTGLETIDEASGLVIEESVRRKRAQRSAGSSETLDLVVGGEALGALGTVRRRLSHGCIVIIDRVRCVDGWLEDEKVVTAGRLKSWIFLSGSLVSTGQQLAWLC